VSSTRDFRYGRHRAFRRFRYGGSRSDRSRYCGCRGRRHSGPAPSLTRLFASVRLGSLKMLANQLGMTQINRTGMGLLFGHPDFGQIIQHHSGFYFQFAGQFVDAYLIWVSHL
jgi:hypothetical protein